MTLYGVMCTLPATSNYHHADTARLIRLVSRANVQFGERLKSERERLCLTQKQLAAIGGVAERTYINYEGGRRTPDAPFLARLAGAGVNIGLVMAVALSGEMPEPALAWTRIELALRAVRDAESERLSFLRADLLVIAVQHVATFGGTTRGGYLAAARGKVHELLGAAPKGSKR